MTKKSIEERFESQHLPVTESGCWLWSGATSMAGYGQLHKDGKTYYAHRLSYEMHKGEIPDGKFVCHRCDVPSCVNPSHLFAGSHEDNMADMTSKGRGTLGEINGQSKLSEADVINIRAIYEYTKATQQKLADIYNVSRSLIGLIISRERWGHI